MKYFILTIKLVLTIYIAKYLSGFVISDQYISVSILFAGSVCFLLLPWKHKFILFSLMIFFPVALPSYLNMPMNTLAETMSPVLCILAVLELLIRRQSFFSSKASLYFVAIGILVLWSIVHYINNPVMGQKVFGSALKSGGIRAYYQVVIGVTTFLCSYWFFKNNEVNVDRWLLISLILAISVGYLFIIESFTGRINTSALLSMGPSADAWDDKYQYHSLPLRIIATLVCVLLLCVFHKRKWGFSFIIIFIQMFVFLLLGGGRSQLPAIILSLSAYVIFINRKYLFPVISVLLIGTGIYILFLSDITFSKMKYGRVFATEGGLKKQSDARYYSFLYRLEIFQSSPIFGKGIGFEKIRAQEDFFTKYPEAIKYIEFIESQAAIGGHGAYLSILSIFGIGGLFFLMVMLYGSIYYSYRIIKMRGEVQNDVKLALFAFLYLTGFSVTFTVGGDGYTELKFWYLAGIVAGLLSKNRINGEIELSNS